MCWSYGADLANNEKQRCIKETLKEVVQLDARESTKIIYAGMRLSFSTCQILDVSSGIYSTRKCNDVITDRFICAAALPPNRYFYPKSHPESNICTGQTQISSQFKQIFCSAEGVGTAQLGMQNDASIMSLNGNHIPVIEPGLFEGLEDLRELSLSGNQIRDIMANGFQDLERLETLDLSNNELEGLTKDVYKGLWNLKDLRIEGNKGPLTLEPSCFEHLENLETLVLSSTKIQGGSLKGSMFSGLFSLKVLHFVGSNIHTISKDTFKHISNVKTIDLRNNSLANTKYERQMFGNLSNLISLSSDHMALCCIAPKVPKCDPQPDYLSSCMDLIKSDMLRIALWVVGLLILLGNITVMGLRARQTSESSNINRIMVINLSISDFLMGAYIVIIAAMDIRFRGKYAENQSEWVNGRICMIAGFVVSLSSQMSVFTLVTMTFDRFSRVVFPFKHSLHLTKRTACTILASGWILCVSLSGLPLLPLTYFGSHAFYSQYGFCLPLVLVNFHFQGWEYSFALFNVATFVGFLLVAACYLAMYCSTVLRHRSTRTSHTGPDIRDMKMARKMLWIVVTDFCCWVPIAILGFLALCDITLPGDKFAYVSIFVLPINSAINPMIYTFSTIPWRKMFCKSSSVNNSQTPQTGLSEIRNSLGNAHGLTNA
ncbi:unnamed protein product [Owenia fusiformis]|uniref:Uncharacterized protein n=1 Tax=Owenia fusiformis TaxID=6347 RepID=A0A8J1TG71_OWEFU|nr:unnamed protein product [Owenia fusiformis]